MRATLIAHKSSPRRTAASSVTHFPTYPQATVNAAYAYTAPGYLDNVLTHASMLVLTPLQILALLPCASLRRVDLRQRQGFYEADRRTQPCPRYSARGIACLSGTVREAFFITGRM